jgi:hypothetical protein
MTLLFMDGFDTGDLYMKYPGSGFGAWVPSNTTRFGYGRSVTIGWNGGTWFKNFPASSKVIIGVAGNTSSLNTPSCSNILLSGDAGLTQHLSLRLQSNGSIKLHLGDGGTVLATSAAAMLTSGPWFFLEISATVADSGGRCIVKVNGATAIDFTGDTKNGGTNSTLDCVRFAAATNGAENNNTYYDDLYICDGLGSVNNDFLGDVRVQTLLPTGAGSSTQFTPSTGSNWDNVNDVPYVAGTYNSDSTSGHRDTYAMSDLMVGTGTIFGVQDNILALKSDAGAANIKAALKSGSTVYYDSDAALGTSLAGFQAVREIDPATSAVWNPTNVNAIEFGAEVV